jgi:hypothetical protein
VFDRYSHQARTVVERAEAEARQLGHPHIGTEHLLLGLLGVDGSAAGALRGAGARLDAARSKVAEAVGVRAASPFRGDLAFSARAGRALDRAARSSLQRRDDQVETAHLLLGVLDVEGRAGQVLRGLGVDHGRLRAAVEPTGGEGSPDEPDGPDEPGDMPPTEPPAAETPTNGAVAPPVVVSAPAPVPEPPATPEPDAVVPAARTAAARRERGPAPAPARPTSLLSTALAAAAAAPRCAACGVGLEHRIAHRVLASTGDDGGGGGAVGRRILLVHCAGCGAALGVLPA